MISCLWCTSFNPFGLRGLWAFFPLISNRTMGKRIATSENSQMKTSYLVWYWLLTQNQGKREEEESFAHSFLYTCLLLCFQITIIKLFPIAWVFFFSAFQQKGFHFRSDLRLVLHVPGFLLLTSTFVSCTKDTCQLINSEE
ncbi:hypothetical protein VNO77_44084 [Canavalia gladiata]|uniref:Uncharacterized protein n=1 Tax=Canavalia gladiata TaxID=3824 RepID=A0AAN9JXE8_CANGL